MIGDSEVECKAKTSTNGKSSPTATPAKHFELELFQFDRDAAPNDDLLSQLSSLQDKGADSVSPVPSAHVASGYVATLLVNFRTLWQLVQHEVAGVVSAAHIRASVLHVDDFASVLEGLGWFLRFGERLARSDANGSLALRNAVAQKARAYFAEYHRDSFEQFRVRLENETWRRLVVSSATATQIEQLAAPPSAIFSTDDQKLVTDFLRTGELPECLAAKEQGDEEQRKGQDAKVEAVDKETNVDAKTKRTPDDNVTAKKETSVNLPAVAVATSMALAKHMVKYLRLMEAYPAMSAELFDGIEEMRDFFIYTAFVLFGIDRREFFEAGAETAFPALRRVVNEIRDRIDAGTFGSGSIFKRRRVSIIGRQQRPSRRRSAAAPGPVPPSATASNNGRIGPTPPTGPRPNGRQSSPNPAAKSKSKLFAKKEAKKKAEIRVPSLVRLNSKVDIKSRMNLYGFNERLNAGESVVFLTRIVKHMQPRLVRAMPQAMRGSVSSFESDSTLLCREFRALTHKRIARLLIDTPAVSARVASCKWDLRELRSGNNGYVDSIASELRDAMRVIRAHGELPPHIERNALREGVGGIICTLVASFAKITKCTTEGRAAMLLDLNVLKTSLMEATLARPLPKWAHINDFIQAFYITEEEELCKWISAHPGYTLAEYRNIAAVGNAGAALRSRKREKFVHRIEGLCGKDAFQRARAAVQAKVEDEEGGFYESL